MSRTVSFQDQVTFSHDFIRRRYLRHYDPKLSREPSYSKLTIPYHVICAERIREQRRKQKIDFERELELHQMLRSRAREGVRIHRQFVNPLMEKIDPKDLIKVTLAERKQIHELLTLGYRLKMGLGKCKALEDLEKRLHASKRKNSK
ncbi:uncharacterized protein LOC109594129 isoform X2 [Aethina tumida]|uniref:uncharacterized protein LOC109594129 isoform X2 n=1 Tax=Aethina tumida TaxID=116153 RepID=UPI002148FF98|nr:uncharacterized protein LOC109594129 isoform X2 [Aethina tumida]